MVIKDEKKEIVMRSTRKVHQMQKSAGPTGAPWLDVVYMAQHFVFWP